MNPKVLANNPLLNVVNPMATHLITHNKAIHEELLHAWESAPAPEPQKKKVNGVEVEYTPNKPKQPLFIEPGVAVINGPCYLFIRKKKCVRNVPKPVCDIVLREYQNNFSYIQSGLRSANEPQKPIIARQLFMRSFFEDKRVQNKVNVENGGQPVKGPILSGEPSAAWKAMTPEQKRPYEEAARLAKEEYERARAAYYSQQPRIPKTPTKAHYLYASANPNGPNWGTLNDAERLPFKQQEEKERAAYNAELEVLREWCNQRGQDFESLTRGLPIPPPPVVKTRKRREPPTEGNSTETTTEEQQPAVKSTRAKSSSTKPKRTKSTTNTKAKSSKRQASTAPKKKRRKTTTTTEVTVNA
jgi:hypothetical protein